MGFGTIGTTVGAFGALFEYLKPSRSPYLIPALTASVSLAFYAGYGVPESLKDFVTAKLATDDLTLVNALYLVPILVALALFVFFSLRFRDPRLQSAPKDKVDSELDGQFKFSRSLGVSVGFIAIFELWAFSNYSIDVFRTVAYVASIVQIVTFIVYMAMQNVRVDNPKNHAVFQISFLMCATLILLVMVSNRIVLGADNNFVWNCEFEREVEFLEVDDHDSKTFEDVTVPGCDLSAMAVDPDPSDNLEVVSQSDPKKIRNAPDAYFLIFLCVLAMWAYLEAFWLRYLVRALRVSITIVEDAEMVTRPPSRTK